MAKHQLILEVDKLNALLLDKEHVLQSVKKESENSLAESKRLSDQIVQYEIRETERNSLERELEHVRQEALLIQSEMKRQLVERDDCIDSMEEQLMRVGSLQEKLRDYQSKVESLKEAQREIESLKLKNLDLNS